MKQALDAAQSLRSAANARLRDRRTFLAVMPAMRTGQALLLLVLAAGGEHGLCQSSQGAPSPPGFLFVDYTEPGVASCPVVSATAPAAAKTVQLGVPVPGRIRAACGLDQGSYTVSLNSTDRDATFVPKTLIVNFGRFVGDGAFTVTFSNTGVQTVNATITSNMGSPPTRGQFAGTANSVNVLMP